MIQKLTSSVKENNIIILIMLLSIFVCFWQIGFGADQSIYPDETFFDSYAFKMIDYARGNGIDYQLDPSVYPAILAIVFAFYCAIGMLTGVFSSVQDFIIHFATHREDFIIAGRIVSALFAVLTVYFTYKTAKELFEKRVAHLAALGVAICYPLVWFAHTVHHTTISACISIWIVYAVIRVWKNPSWRNYLYTGILIGIGIGVKLYPGMFALSLILVHFRTYRFTEKSSWSSFPKLAVTGMVAAFVACICYPWPIIEHAQWQAAIEHSTDFYEGGSWWDNLRFLIWGKSDYYTATIAEPFTFWSNSLRILSETSLILIGVSLIFLFIKRPFLFWVLCLPFVLFLVHHTTKGGLTMGARQFYFLLPVFYICAAYFVHIVLVWLKPKPALISYAIVGIVFVQPVYWLCSYLAIISNPTTIQTGKEWLTKNVEPGAYIFVNYAAPFNNISTWEITDNDTIDPVIRERLKLLPPFHIKSIREDNFASEILKYQSMLKPMYVVLSDYNSSTAYYFYENCKLWGMHKYFKFPRKYAFYTSVRNHGTLVEQIIAKEHKAIGPSISIYKLEYNN